MYTRIDNPKQVASLPLVMGTFGCPCGRHVSVDPYWDAVDWHEAARGDGGSYSGVVDWHEAARGDGGSYSGVVEWVERQPGEAFAAFMARATRRAAALDHCDRR